MQLLYRFLADVVLAVHLAYVSFVVIGLVVIVLGVALRWNWVRNPWFRWIHLMMISIVAVQAILGIMCPLTVWEDRLRVLAGQQPGTGTFVQRIMDAIMFPEWPDWAFLPVYVGFAALVIATFVLAPPRRRPRQNRSVSVPSANESAPAEHMVSNSEQGVHR